MSSKKVHNFHFTFVPRLIYAFEYASRAGQHQVHAGHVHAARLLLHRYVQFTFVLRLFFSTFDLRFISIRFFFTFVRRLILVWSSLTWKGTLRSIISARSRQPAVHHRPTTSKTSTKHRDVTMSLFGPNESFKLTMLEQKVNFFSSEFIFYLSSLHQLNSNFNFKLANNYLHELHLIRRVFLLLFRLMEFAVETFLSKAFSRYFWIFSSQI